MAAWVKFKSNNTYGAGIIRRKLERLGAMQVVIHGPTETFASFSKRHAAGPWLEKLAKTSERPWHPTRDSPRARARGKVDAADGVRVIRL